MCKVWGHWCIRHISYPGQRGSPAWSVVEKRDVWQTVLGSPYDEMHKPAHEATVIVLPPTHDGSLQTERRRKHLTHTKQHFWWIYFTWALCFHLQTVFWIIIIFFSVAYSSLLQLFFPHSWSSCYSKFLIRKVIIWFLTTIFTGCFCGCTFKTSWQQLSIKTLFFTSPLTDEI